VLKPTRVQLILVAVLVVVVTIAGLVAFRPKTASASDTTTTTLPCQSKKLTTDYEIDQCLTTNIRTMTTRMESALRKESVYLRYGSRSKDWRVAQRTQSTFVAYAHEECLAQSNPYQPGTIVPILYGECVVTLYNQRLNYIDQTITAFKNGGEAQGSS
jgi:uncharacterized protein YecT (DUF1311 family)